LGEAISGVGTLPATIDSFILARQDSKLFATNRADFDNRIDSTGASAFARAELIRGPAGNNLEGALTSFANQGHFVFAIHYLFSLKTESRRLKAAVVVEATR
jgi:hypothetical protein